jgi:hypothetical protein
MLKYFPLERFDTGECLRRLLPRSCVPIVTNRSLSHNILHFLQGDPVGCRRIIIVDISFAASPHVSEPEQVANFMKNASRTWW